MYVPVQDNPKYFTLWQQITYDENFQLPALCSLSAP